MTDSALLPLLAPAGLLQFAALRGAAIDAVADRFLAEEARTYQALGPRARDACREDLAFHLEFLRPALEFGLLQPLVEYLRWLASVLAARGIPAAHVPVSLAWLGEFFAGRMEAPHGAAVAAVLESAGKRLAEPVDPMESLEANLPPEWPRECAAFEAALLAGSRTHATAVLEESMARGGLVGAELHVIQPALYRIGRKWQVNEVSVAQEHLATAIAQSVMTVGLVRSEVPRSNGRKVLLACVEGNQHALGLQMVSDAFQLAGWEVQCLGANVPTAALVSQVAAWQPQLVGISVAFAHQLPAVRGAISALTAALGEGRPPVIVGGLALNRFKALAAHMGAEGWSADAAAAATSGLRLADAAR